MGVVLCGAMPATKPIRTGREVYARFFEQPSREALRSLLQNHIGETADLDFKREWPSRPELAKHVLGFANGGGGVLVVGVEEREDKTVEAVGLSVLNDKVDLHDSIKKFIPSSLRDNVAIEDFHYEDSEYAKIKGLRFQVMIVDGDPTHMPYISTAESTGIRSGAIYIHREGGTSEATHDELQKIINRRIGTGYSSTSELRLKEHLEQLKILYGEIERTTFSLGGLGSTSTLLNALSGLSKPNAKYPSEDYSDFVSRMIERKKARVEKVLDL